MEAAATATPSDCQIDSVSRLAVATSSVISARDHAWCRVVTLRTRLLTIALVGDAARGGGAVVVAGASAAWASRPASLAWGVDEGSSFRPSSLNAGRLCASAGWDGRGGASCRPHLSATGLLRATKEQCSVWAGLRQSSSLGSHSAPKRFPSGRNRSGSHSRPARHAGNHKGRSRRVVPWRSGARMR